MSKSNRNRNRKLALARVLAALSVAAPAGIQGATTYAAKAEVNDDQHDAGAINTLNIDVQEFLECKAVSAGTSGNRVDVADPVKAWMDQLGLNNDTDAELTVNTFKKFRGDTNSDDIFKNSLNYGVVGDGFVTKKDYVAYLKSGILEAYKNDKWADDENDAVLTKDTFYYPVYSGEEITINSRDGKDVNKKAMFGVDNNGKITGEPKFVKEDGVEAYDDHTHAEPGYLVIGNVTKNTVELCGEGAEDTWLHYTKPTSGYVARITAGWAGTKNGNDLEKGLSCFGFKKDDSSKDATEEGYFETKEAWDRAKDNLTVIETEFAKNAAKEGLSPEQQKEINLYLLATRYALLVTKLHSALKKYKKGLGMSALSNAAAALGGYASGTDWDLERLLGCLLETYRKLNGNENGLMRGPLLGVDTDTIIGRSEDLKSLLSLEQGVLESVGGMGNEVFKSLAEQVQKLKDSGEKAADAAGALAAIQNRYQKGHQGYVDIQKEVVKDLYAGKTKEDLENEGKAAGAAEAKKTYDAKLKEVQEQIPGPGMLYGLPAGALAGGLITGGLMGKTFFGSPAVGQNRAKETLTGPKANAAPKGSPSNSPAKGTKIKT